MGHFDEKVALVTGAKSKLGHQVVIKLLMSGAIVIGTTRQPQRMRDMFLQYPSKLCEKLNIYPRSLDFDCNNIKDLTIPLVEQTRG